MTSGYEFRSVDDLRALFDANLGRVERIDEVAASLGLDGIGAGLRDTWFRLKQGPIRVLITGCSSAGKSTLINALANEIVVPEGKHTTSPIPVLIESRCKDDCAQVRLLHADSEHLGEQENYGLYRFLTDFCYTQEEAGQGASEHRYDTILSAHVRVGSGLLSETGITLIDTPGVGMAESDDARVRRILDGGCEILIALFRDADIQQQHIKDFFCQLFVNDGAPLRALHESGRVFMVSNYTIDPYTTEQIAGKHLMADFGMSSDRLILINARHARIAACGIYRYTNYLPMQYSEDDWIYAEKSTSEERGDLWDFQPEEAMDALADFSRTIGYAVEDFCADEDAVTALLASVDVPIFDAITALHAHIEMLKNDAKKADIDVPEELLLRRNIAENQIFRLDQLMESMTEMFENANNPYGFAWPGDDQIFGHNDVPEIGLLIAEPDANKETVFLDLLMKSGTEAVSLRVCKRATKFKQKCYKLVKSYIKDHIFEKIDAVMVEAQKTMEPLLHDESAQYTTIWRTYESHAWDAGHAAMLQAWEDVFSETMKKKSNAFLLPIRTNIHNGGFGGGWSKFWAYPNYISDFLGPIVRSAAQNGKLAFFHAYRNTLEAEKETVYSAFRSYQQKARTIAVQEKKDADDAIEAYIFDTRRKMIERLDVYQMQMNDYIEHGGELPRYECV
ncbi:MAG: hypothetical protein E7604_07355 [Ruminococcaceae bacterium]|nr:hypothetical protein [Oscillospiraceae bacterium]